MSGFKKRVEALQMSSDFSIQVNNLGKCYHVYKKPRDRLKQFLIQGLNGIIGVPIGEPYYREFWALKDVSFEVKRGETVGIVGRNGSGKSTLLRVLAGAYTPTSGHLDVEGKVASLLDIGLGMDGEASGYENILIRGILMGMSKSEVEEKIKDIAEFTDLGDYLYMPMRTYSSGMSMRLGFAVSTSTNADIILMDEWLSVGDSAFAEKATARMNDLLNRSSIMVLASHDLGMIERVCNTAIRLEHGKISEKLF